MFTLSLPLLPGVYSPQFSRKLWKKEGSGGMDEEPWRRLPGLALVFLVNLAVIVLFQNYIR